MKITKKVEILLLGILLLFGLIFRLYRFNNPIADWHSWRQADTSSVSRNFVQNGFDIFHPRYHDLSNVPSGLDNPQGYRFVEFPIYNIFQAGMFKMLGIFTLEEWGRITTISSSLLSAVFLFYIFSFRKNSLLGLTAAFFFLFIPYNIYYGRTILPDTSMAMAVLGSIYFFQKWLAFQKVSIFNLQFLVSLIFMISAFLLKPYAIFFTIPLIVLSFEKFGKEFFKKPQLWLFAIISVIPLISWRIWMSNFPQGVPASAWLLNGNGIRFRPAFFRWIFYERLVKLISGYFGVIIFLFGILSLKKSKDFLFIASFGISSLLYIFVIATGNVQHDYYQILVMPSVSILFAVGAIFLYHFKINKFSLGKIILIFSLISLFSFGWIQAKDYFNINNPSIVIAGDAVDKLTPKNAKVIANYNGDTSFLYQTKRNGWASFEKPIPQMINMGASYLVLANPTPVDMGLAKSYKLIAKTNQYAIFDLLKKP